MTTSSLGPTPRDPLLHVGSLAQIKSYRTEIASLCAPGTSSISGGGGNGKCNDGDRRRLGVTFLPSPPCCMDGFAPYRSPGTDRILSLLSRPGDSPRATNDGVGGELLEEEVFWMGSESSDPTGSPPAFNSIVPSPAHPISKRSSGILVALQENSSRGSVDSSSVLLLQRKSSISASTSPSSFSSARSIPVIPKPKADYIQAPAFFGKVYHQSAPIDVPTMPRTDMSVVNDEEEEMLPPHEIVAKRSNASPMTTFSVLEGAGRTLKGRDLRRVRNAVWRKTGFLD